MTKEKLLHNLKVFDPELWEVLRDSQKRQLNTLSLIPTTNAASPFASYLRGSALGNDVLDHHAVDHSGRLEDMAVRRACDLFGAEHAIVRIGNPAAASRVVLQALAAPNDTILSFNLRKQEHCTGEQMQYHFVKFGVEPDTLRVNPGKVRALAHQYHPKIIIYSPVNYPHNIDYEELRRIADEVGAYLWVDLGQNAGLIAAKKIDSPVHYADVATFAASDGLHGPQSGIILSKKRLAEHLEQVVIDTGHVSLKKNVLAALVVALKEASCEEYEDYAQQVLDNARALERGLKKADCDLLCSPTENHLVLLHLPENQNGIQTAENLKQAGLLVKPEHLMTADDSISYPILRLSSLDATTRSLQEEDMEKVGQILGDFLHSPQDASAQKTVSKVIRKLVENLPLFSEDWLPELEAAEDMDRDLAMRALLHWRI